ncbi:caffeic acid [Musa troglodytarum]|uniref:Caffeic acid n=1 Tax=Musa troglodytarum TaxID=320322 RepID=A0A9E7KMA9_9LILI|nr:caffeic acid [Musa troglodytarum]
MTAMNEVLRLTPEEEVEEEACMRALQLSSVVILPMTLKVAIELGLFEIIVGAGPGGALSAEEIAAQLPAKNPQAANWVDRLLCLLAANDVVACTVVSADGRSLRKYSMTPVCKQLLRNYDGFAGINVLVDVGGNDGATLRMITSQHPRVKGINFDLPHVISTAQPIPGVQHVSGDMFDSVPCGDAIFLKWILHDWSDDLCVTLLKNCWKSLPENGKVLVVEYIRPVAPAATAKAQFVFQLDLVMLAHCIGGKERTEEEFRALATEAGFAGFNAAAMFAGMSVLEFTK